jgi:hypothetical protein
MTEEATATVTLFNTKGQPLVLPAVSLAPELPARFDLSQLANQPDFESGNVQIAFNGMSMGITSQVSVISTARRVAFESVEDKAMDFSSSRLDGILWLPDSDTQARLALTNTTASPVTATVSGAGHGEERKVTLGPHETELVEANGFIESVQAHEAASTLVSIQHDASPGSVMITGFAVNDETGFSTNFPFVDRTALVSTKLAGAHARIGLPNPAEGFPAGTRFSAPLILANAGAQPTQASVWLDYTIDSIPHRIQVGMESVVPGQTRQFELSQALASRGIQGPLDDAGIDVTYTGQPGTVIGRLTSFDQTGDFAFDVPVKDPLAGMMTVGGSYPWQLAGGTTTVVHLKNTINQKVEAIVQVRYNGGTYNPERIPLQPFQTVALDIGRMRDAQAPDTRGGVMPTAVESGQVEWFGMTPGSLIGRAEVANVPRGIASSFSCGGPCQCGPNFNNSSMSTCPMTGPVGSSGQLDVFETDMDCNGIVYGPYNRDSVATWSTSDSSIATVSGGSCALLAPGQCGITANFLATVYNSNQGCQPIPENVGTSCSVTAVQVDIFQDSTKVTNQTQNVIVGQQINLSVQVQPSGISMTKTQWTIPGTVVKNYVIAYTDKQSPTSDVLTALTDLSPSAITYYWVDGADGRVVQVTFKVNGTPFTLQTTFNVKQPTATIRCDTGLVGANTAWGHWVLGFGVPIGPGITLTWSSTTPNGFSGTYEWVQTVNPVHSKTDTNGKVWTFQGAGLDTQYPYPINSDGHVYDSPQVSLTPDANGTYVTATGNDSFQMYYMFQPSFSNSIWVPLNVINWFWSGTAVWDATNQIWDCTARDSSPNPPAPTTTTFPQWTANAGQDKYK